MVKLLPKRWDPLMKANPIRKTDKCKTTTGYTTFLFLLSPASLWVNCGACTADFTLPWHLCFCLQALCLLLSRFRSFDCSSRNVLLPTNHLIPPGALAQLLIHQYTTPLLLLTCKFPVPSLSHLQQMLS